jgi:hypothetical protein
LNEGIDPEVAKESIDRYCAVWNEPDAARRTQLLGTVWADGATYTDPSVHAVGAGELLAHIGKVMAKRPGARVVRTSRIDLHHGLALFFWHIERPDGTFSPDGLDVVTLSPDGRRIERIAGFFGPLPESG